ncbi:MAG: M23 family metallopeptidase [bacterium]
MKSVHKWQIFKKNSAHRAVGVQMAGVAMALSIAISPTHAFDYAMAQSAQNGANEAIVITTQTQYQFPLVVTLGMSQGYHLLHPGVDLRAPIGTAVLAMDAGIVIEVEEMRVGYGHYARIAHNGTMSSLYAHLNKVRVKPGDKVSRGEEIGTVGMTGWTTGPHLHFEVLQGNKMMNPMGYISGKFQ